MSFVRSLVESGECSRPELIGFLERVESGAASRSEVAAVLTALAIHPQRGSTLRDFVAYLREREPPKTLRAAQSAVNIVGTGGGFATFNISTTAAFVASAAGARVLKSGSGAYSSRCGSWDVLRALEIPCIDDPVTLSTALEELGIAFIGPRSYPRLITRLAIKVAPLELRDCGAFVNRVGALLFPYQVAAQLTGVGAEEQIESFSEVLQQSPGRHLLVHASLGIDELCSLGENQLCWIDGGRVDRQLYRPSSSRPASPSDLERLRGGDPSENALILSEVLEGRRDGPALETVLLNAGAMLALAGLSRTLSGGAEMARGAIQDGRAASQLERVRAWFAGASGVAAGRTGTASRSIRRIL